MPSSAEASEKSFLLSFPLLGQADGGPALHKSSRAPTAATKVRSFALIDTHRVRATKNEDSQVRPDRSATLRHADTSEMAASEFASPPPPYGRTPSPENQVISDGATSGENRDEFLGLRRSLLPLSVASLLARRNPGESPTAPLAVAKGMMHHDESELQPRPASWRIKVAASGDAVRGGWDRTGNHISHVQLV